LQWTTWLHPRRPYLNIYHCNMLKCC
jgi:hypothetical protein